jgi:hypothetical protein
MHWGTNYNLQQPYEHKIFKATNTAAWNHCESSSSSYIPGTPDTWGRKLSSNTGNLQKSNICFLTTKTGMSITVQVLNYKANSCTCSKKHPHMRHNPVTHHYKIPLHGTLQRTVSLSCKWHRNTQLSNGLMCCWWWHYKVN